MSWVLANLPTIAGHLLAHLLQAVPAIIASFVLAIPIARLARYLEARAKRLPVPKKRKGVA